MTRLGNALAATAVAAVIACADRVSPRTLSAAQTGGLDGTSWQLVEFRSSDDAIGVVRPPDPTRYTMILAAGRQVHMQLNCNRATGTWSADPPDAQSGVFTFGRLAMTRALCSPPSYDAQIARDAEYVRSYLLRDGRLYLNLMADGGTYVWAPHAPPEQAESRRAP